MFTSIIDIALSRTCFICMQKPLCKLFHPYWPLCLF
jgi:hypothetical protein